MISRQQEFYYRLGDAVESVCLAFEEFFEAEAEYALWKAKNGVQDLSDDAFVEESVGALADVFDSTDLAKMRSILFENGVAFR